MSDWKCYSIGEGRENRVYRFLCGSEVITAYWQGGCTEVIHRFIVGMSKPGSLVFTRGAKFKVSTPEVALGVSNKGKARRYVKIETKGKAPAWLRFPRAVPQSLIESIRNIGRKNHVLEVKQGGAGDSEQNKDRPSEGGGDDRREEPPGLRRKTRRPRRRRVPQKG